MSAETKTAVDPKVRVTGYERGPFGSKISPYERAYPQKPQAPQEQEKAKKDEEKDGKGQDKKRERQDEAPDQEEKGKAKNDEGKKTKTQPEENDKKPDPFKELADEETRRLSIRKALDMEYSKWKQEMTARSAGADPEKNELVARDEQARAEREAMNKASMEGSKQPLAEFFERLGAPKDSPNPNRSALGDQPQQPNQQPNNQQTQTQANQPLPVKALKSKIADAQRVDPTNTTIVSILSSLDLGRYDSKTGEFGPKSLISHLYKAKLFNIAKEVKNGMYAL